MSAAPALELSHVTKRFGSLIALDDVSLVVRPGTVHALLGENGAGKTTLMVVAYGLARADAGVLRINGRELRAPSPADAVAAGVGMVHQHFTLVPAMTVAENLSLGGRGRLRPADMDAIVRAASSRTGFSLDGGAVVETLAVGAQQRVEIAKALGRDASVLILDEPTAVLAPSEVEDFLRWLRRYADDGNSAILITHKLREAAAVADDVTVLRRGRVTYTSVATPPLVEHLSAAMIGETTLDARPASEHTTGEVVFELRSASVVSAGERSALRNASVSVRAGELVGVVGVEGSGQRELLRMLAGRVLPDSGVAIGPPVVGFVPEDRHRDAVLLGRSLTENVVLEGAGARHGTMDWRTAKEKTSRILAELDVRTETADDSMMSLSGGNQQKLVLGRELTAGTRGIVVENPTRGLDVRAAADVRRRLQLACESGVAVVMYSGDVDEVLSLATRVLVVYAGEVREVPNDREQIGRAMVGL